MGEYPAPDDFLEMAYEDRFVVQDRHSDDYGDFDGEPDMTEDEYCYACGEDEHLGDCVKDTDDEPDERNEYRGAGCNATCGC